MAWTQTDVDTIEAAIAGADLSVTYADGCSVTYRSISDLLRARDAMKSSLAGAGSAVRCTYAQFSKG